MSVWENCKETNIGCILYSTVYNVLIKKKKSLQWPGVPQRRIKSGQLSTKCSNATEVAQWGTPICSRPQPATDNGVRDGRFNWLITPTTFMGSTPWVPHAKYKSVQPQHGINQATLSMWSNHLACAAIQSILSSWLSAYLILKNHTKWKFCHTTVGYGLKLKVTLTQILY